MAQRMPREMEEKLILINDPDAIIEIQQQWNKYVAANDKYEQTYPQQFGALVEGNLKFKENKSIPTPAEQMTMYRGMVMEAIEEQLGEKNMTGKEATYELDEAAPQQQIHHDRQGKLELSFTDKSLRDKQEMKNIDQSQDLNLTWLKEHREQK